MCDSDYAIIKAHVREIKVKRQMRPPARLIHSGRDHPVGPGEGSLFIILLPLMERM